MSNFLLDLREPNSCRVVRVQFTAKPPWGDLSDEIRHWLNHHACTKENHGQTWLWVQWWANNRVVGGRFVFQDPNLLMLFKLTWGGQ